MKSDKNQHDLDHSLKLIFKSSLFIFLIIFFSKLMGYIYKFIIARYYGPEIYGSFSLAIMVIVIFLGVAPMGLLEGNLRFISFYRGKNERNKISYLFNFSLKALFISGVIFALILYFSSGLIAFRLLHDSRLFFYLKVLSFILPFYILAYLFFTIIQAHEHIRVHSFISDFLNNFFKVSILLILILAGFNSNSIIFSYALSVLLVFFISLFYCKNKMPEIFGKYLLKKDLKLKIIRDLIQYSFPLVFLGLIGGIFIYTDSFIIGYFNNSKDVGLYNAAYPLAELLIFFPTLFFRLFFPLATKEFSKRNIDLIRQLSKQVEKWILIIILPVFLLMIIYPGAILNLLFGSEFLGATNALRILAVGFFFYSLSMIFYNLLSIVGKSKLILIDIASFSFINLFLNIIMVPKYGINGAAFTTALCQISLSLVLFLQVRHYTSIVPLRRKMFRVILSISISSFVLLFLRGLIPLNLITLIMQGLLFFFLYILLIFITKSLDYNDLTILSQIKEKFFKGQ